MIPNVFTQKVTLPAKIVNHFLIKPKLKFKFCEAMFFVYNYLDYLSKINNHKRNVPKKSNESSGGIVYAMHLWNEHEGGCVLVFHEKY